MINEMQWGMAPDGIVFDDKTPNRPGIFLSRKSRDEFRKELPAALASTYVDHEAEVVVGGWATVLYFMVPEPWSRVSHKEYMKTYSEYYGLNRS